MGRGVGEISSSKTGPLFLKGKEMEIHITRDGKVWIRNESEGGGWIHANPINIKEYSKISLGRKEPQMIELKEWNPESERLIEALIKAIRADFDYSPAFAFSEAVRVNPDLIKSADKQARACLLAKLVNLEMQARNLSYSEAFTEVQRANPKLTLQYQRDLRGR